MFQLSGPRSLILGSLILVPEADFVGAPGAFAQVCKGLVRCCRQFWCTRGDLLLTEARDPAVLAGAESRPQVCPVACNNMTLHTQLQSGSEPHRKRKASLQATIASGALVSLKP